MFLFMQLVNRKNICDLVDDSERYPVASMQLSADRLSKSREHSAELTVLKFIQRNLRDIMEIISLHGNEVRDYKNPELSCYSCSGAGLKCLDDIFEGREVDTIKNVVSFSSLCKLRFDFTKDLNLKSVEKWIRCSLGSDPYAVASSSYQNASVSNNSHLKSGYLGDLRAILHNSHSAPLNRKTVILNGITRKTVIKRCTFNISTNSRPLIFGTGNENLVFGPYNMTKFSDEKSPKVDNFTDFGDQPLCFRKSNDIYVVKKR
uniref:Uncharacterized protein n=1 Tax=Romanomermis culicivorax TaxID=13658 RepID=A0A915IM82_ROMCU